MFCPFSHTKFLLVRLRTLLTGTSAAGEAAALLLVPENVQEHDKSATAEENFLLWLWLLASTSTSSTPKWLKNVHDIPFIIIIINLCTSISTKLAKFKLAGKLCKVSCSSSFCVGGSIVNELERNILKLSHLQWILIWLLLGQVY